MNTVCTTQAEVDAAAAAGEFIVIKGTSWRDNASAVLWGNARAFLWGNARAVLRDDASADLWDNASAVLWGNARAYLWGNARAYLWGNARAVLWGNARAVLWGNARAVLWGNARAVLRDNARADLRDNARAVLRDNARADLRDNARADLRDDASAYLRDDARADLRGNASADLWDNARADLWDDASAALWDNARAVLRGWFATARLIGDLAVVEGIGRSLRVIDVDTYAQYQGLDIDGGHVTLFKAVTDRNTGGGGYNPLTYVVGEETVAPDWDPSIRECGGGLHLCPTIDQAREHCAGAVAVLACRVAVADVAVYEFNLSKVRVRACTPTEVVWGEVAS